MTSSSLVCRSFVIVGVVLLAGVGRADPPAATTPLKVEDRLMNERFSRARPPGTVVDVVMLHFSSDVIAHPDDPYRVDRVVATYEGGPASAHYLIDREGKVYRLVKEERAAFHGGKGKLPWLADRENKLNATSIGIEMMAIGSKADMKIFMSGEKYDAYAKRHPENIGFTDKQYASLRALMAEIYARHPEVKADRRHVVGHADYAAGRRTDPGELFGWDKIDLPKEAGK